MKAPMISRGMIDDNVEGRGSSSEGDREGGTGLLNSNVKGFGSEQDVKR